MPCKRLAWFYEGHPSWKFKAGILEDITFHSVSVGVGYLTLFWFVILHPPKPNYGNLGRQISPKPNRILFQWQPTDSPLSVHPVCHLLHLASILHYKPTGGKNKILEHSNPAGSLRADDHPFYSTPRANIFSEFDVNKRSD